MYFARNAPVLDRSRHGMAKVPDGDAWTSRKRRDVGKKG